MSKLNGENQEQLSANSIINSNGLDIQFWHCCFDTVATGCAALSPRPFVIRLRVENISNHNRQITRDTVVLRIPFPFLGVYFQTFTDSKERCCFFFVRSLRSRNVLLIRSLEIAPAPFTVCIPLVRIVYLTTLSIILLFIGRIYYVSSPLERSIQYFFVYLKNIFIICTDFHELKPRTIRTILELHHRF